MEKYFYISSAFSISVLLSMVVIPKILLISAKKKLYDIPDARKIHHNAISRLGGVAFLPIILFSLGLLYATYNLVDLNYYIDRVVLSTAAMTCCGSIILFLVGIADDLIGLRYKSKFVAQIFSAGLVTLSGVYFNNLHGFFGIYEIPAYIGIPLTIFTVVYIINAINLIDGVDGLASAICSLVLIGLGIHFAALNMWIYTALCAVTFGVLVPFFFFNVFGDATKGRKIFMGDTGSLTLGFLISVLVIKYSITEPTSVSSNPIGYAFSFLLIPLLDVIRVVIHRVRTHKHPFKPDRNHIHHKFLDAGLTPHQTMILIVFIAVALSVANTLLFRINDTNINVVLAIDITFYAVLNIVLTYIIKSRVRQGTVLAIQKEIK